MEIAQAGPHELEVTATLVDERPADNPKWFGSNPPPVIHDMRLGLRVRHLDLVVTEVRSGMASHPYTICPEALPPLQQLVGLSIARGFTREVNERSGRQRGCAHFTALIHAVPPRCGRAITSDESGQAARRRAARASITHDQPMKIMSIPTSVPITQTAAPGSCRQM